MYPPANGDERLVRGLGYARTVGSKPDPDVQKVDGSVNSLARYTFVANGPTYDAADDRYRANCRAVGKDRSWPIRHFSRRPLYTPGRPEEFHLQSPTDPYVNLSIHTARASHDIAVSRLQRVTKDPTFLPVARLT